MQYRLAALVAFLFAGFATSAQGAAIITASEVGSDVVFTGAGSLDRTEWTGLANIMDNGRLDPMNALLLGAPTMVAVDSRNGPPTGFTGPSSIGTGSSAFAPT